MVPFVTASGVFRLGQVIFQGKSKKTGAVPKGPGADELKAMNVDMIQTDNHWSNYDAMIKYVDDVIVPYVKEVSMVPSQHNPLCFYIGRGGAGHFG